MKDTVEKSGLEKMREPFPAHQISKLPKPTKRQTDEVRQDFKKGVRCNLCGGWHHPQVVHLDYVGHAALTDRLLDCDPNWNWEPVTFNEQGFPALDGMGGMWIKLTVCGVTRLGYGHAEGKQGGDAIKEVIGDALRNAAMRFGAALDLWHKGDLHAANDPADESDGNAAAQSPPKDEKPAGPPQHAIDTAKQSLFNAADLEALKAIWTELPNEIRAVRDVENAKDARKAELDAAPKRETPEQLNAAGQRATMHLDNSDDPDLGGDEIPYQ